jgi:hypothetical protein
MADFSKTSRRNKKDLGFNGIANALCFHKTENNRFQLNSGGVFMTQPYGLILA